MPHCEQIGGSCTPEGTQRYRSRQHGVCSDFYSEAHGLLLSSIGLGTCLGLLNAQTDQAVTGAACQLALAGCNVFDSAPNYRNGRAEACIGEALKLLLRQGVERDQLFVSTKVGIVPENVIGALSTGSLLPAHLVDLLPTGQCFSPAYIRWQVEQSRRRLGVETIDCVFLHNVEEAKQVRAVGFADLLSAAFEALEGLASSGTISSYGLATWHGLRCPNANRLAMNLWEAAETASGVEGQGHHLRCIQLPVGLWAPEALTLANQTNENGGIETPLATAAHLGLTVFASAPLRHGELANTDLSFLRGLPQLSAAQQLVQFARSVPGVATVLVGLKKRQHVEEMLSLATMPRTVLDTLSIVE